MRTRTDGGTECGAPRSVSRVSPIPWACSLGLVLFQAAVLAFNGSQLRDLVRRHSEWTLAANPAIAALVLGLPALSLLLRHGRRRAAFGRTTLDRTLLAGVATFGLALIEVDLLRVLRGPATARGVELLGVTAALLAQSACAAVCAARLAPFDSVRARLARVATKALSSSALVCGLSMPLEAWVAGRPLRDWYAVEATDGSGASLHTSDPDMLWKMVPNYRGRVIHPELGGVLIETNSLGLRERELMPVTGRYEGLLLGDSFAHGLGVGEEQMLSRRLELEGAAARVWNAGVIGFATLDELVMLERLAGSIQPSFVVLLIYLGNDFEENLWRAQRWIDDGRSAALAALVPEAPDLLEDLRRAGPDTRVVSYRLLLRRSWLRLKLEKRLALFRTLADAIDRRLARRGGTPGMPPINDMLVRSFAREPDERTRLAFRLSLACVRALTEHASALGARTLVCLAPARLQVDADLFRDSLRRLGLDQALYDVDRPQQELAHGCAAAGIPLLDLTADLRASQARGERPYFAEGHWNRTGHALAAKSIAQRLRAPPFRND